MPVEVREVRPEAVTLEDEHCSNSLLEVVVWRGEAHHLSDGGVRQDGFLNFERGDGLSSAVDDLL
jgi:hypothetical protein